MKSKLSKSAFKFLQKLNREDQIRIISAIEKLPKGDVVPMKGRKTTAYRLRVGKYRILFAVKDDVAIVADIGNRGDVYK